MMEEATMSSHPLPKIIAPSTHYMKGYDTRHKITQYI